MCHGEVTPRRRLLAVLVMSVCETLASITTAAYSRPSITLPVVALSGFAFGWLPPPPPVCSSIPAVASATAMTTSSRDPYRVDSYRPGSARYTGTCVCRLRCGPLAPDLRVVRLTMAATARLTLVR
jgi:hypothetical protein